jgi:diguanylate cyclase (GGDEF)-like protein
VLRVLAGVFQSVLRTTDHLGRFGGEEFVVLLPDTAQDGAMTTAERLRSAVADTALKGRDGEPITCTISIGVTEWNPADSSIEDALKRADTALYQAKRAGRNAVRCAMAEAVVA